MMEEKLNWRKYVVENCLLGIVELVARVVGRAKKWGREEMIEWMSNLIDWYEGFDVRMFWNVLRFLASK